MHETTIDMELHNKMLKEVFAWYKQIKKTNI